MSTHSEVSYNPFDINVAKNPHEVLKEVRSKCPVMEVSDHIWYLSKHEDVYNAFPDYKNFNSKGGFSISYNNNLSTEGLAINAFDPPEHTKLRKLYMSALNASTYKSTEPFIRKTAKELISKFVNKGEAELYSELATPLPAMVAHHILGLPIEDHAKLGGWFDEGLQLASKKGISPSELMYAGTEEELENLPEPVKKFHDYVLDQIKIRRNSANPPDDIITRMINFVDEDGKRISNLNALVQIRFMISAGHETTKNLLGNMLYELISQPELYQRVRENRELVPAAVEETLRKEGSVRVILRTAERDMELRGTSIRKGDRVILGIASANRDEEVFENPNEFRLDRGRKGALHTSFGRGAHVCIGAELARLEASVLLNEFLDQFPEISFAPGFTVEKRDSYWENGVKRLDVVFP